MPRAILKENQTREDAPDEATMSDRVEESADGGRHAVEEKNRHRISAEDMRGRMKWTPPRPPPPVRNINDVPPPPPVAAVPKWRDSDKSGSSKDGSAPEAGVVPEAIFGADSESSS